MKKTLLSLAIITSFTTLSTTVYADTHPTVLYFHNEDNEPIKDFPFKAQLNEEHTLYTALDDGYKVIDGDVSTIEIAGNEYTINPGVLNEIEIVDPALVLESVDEVATSEAPILEQHHTIKVNAVDRSFTHLEDGTIIYLKLDGQVIDETEVTDGVVEFNDVDSKESYEVSYSKENIESTPNEPLTIEAGEEKYLVYEAQTKPIKRERSPEKLKQTLNSDGDAIHRAPDDRPPLLKNRDKAEKSAVVNTNSDSSDSESYRERNTSSKRSNVSRDVKPQLPVEKPTVNPITRAERRADAKQSSTSDNANTADYSSNSSSSSSDYSSDSSSSNDYASDTSSFNGTLSHKSTTPTLRKDSKQSKYTPSSDGDYASDSSYASDSNYSSGSNYDSNSDSNSRDFSSSRNDSSNNHTSPIKKSYSKYKSSSSDDESYLPETGEAMSQLLPIAGLMAISAGIALLYFTRKKKKDM
ncbi:LPXTG cell wall anchor domain-containing protein [Macrococcus sp. EM39E]|uniref:LPXTG cell wall anchor domain-containing protein n=1 Tax=Macrococcus animalis TaxID=3395467 RepID=UPI0039BECC20